MDKQKNGINQDLRSLFEQNPTEWFTNDQLAERLQKPVISVRNALSKTKWNGEVLTRLTGCIEFRAWHTASFDEPLPITDVQKRIAARTCNSCQTSFSRYWRSDLLAPGFLCNNCGMNQRRGQNPKQSATKAYDFESSDEEYEPDYEYLDGSGENQPEIEMDGSKELPSESEQDNILEQVPSLNSKRKLPYPTYIEPCKRKCAHCTTSKSAGKWRRDREAPERYLCNKCGMNQRRQQSKKGKDDNGSPITAPKPKTKNCPPPCSICREHIPTLVHIECEHRICSECIPRLLYRVKDTSHVPCPTCANDGDSIQISIAELGCFLDAF